MFEAIDDQGRKWIKSEFSATRGLKCRRLSAEETAKLQELADEAHSMVQGLAFPDSVENATFEATVGPYNRNTYRREGFNAFHSIRRLTTARTAVRKAAGPDSSIAAELGRIIKDMKAITGTPPRGL